MENDKKHGIRRFTPDFSKAIQLANQEAQRLNHEYIGTEHMLLGLVKYSQNSDNKSMNILENITQKTPQQVMRLTRFMIEQIVQKGPEMVIMGKLPQTPRGKKVIEYAIDEAAKMNSDVCIIHLLLGLLREGEGVAAHILNDLGVFYNNVLEKYETSRTIALDDETMKLIQEKDYYKSALKEIKEIIDRHRLDCLDEVTKILKEERFQDLL